MTRRSFLRAAGALAVLGLGGCRVGVTSEDTAPGSTTSSLSATSTTNSSTTTSAEASTTTTMPSPSHITVVAPPADIPNLDPIKWAESGIQRLYRPSVESLYRWQPGGVAEPVLAAGGWDVSRDGLVYSIHLRPDVTFHDGTPFDAASVVSSFRAVLDPINGSQWSSRFASHVADIEASGTSTVVFRLHQRFSPFETLLGLIPIVSNGEGYEPQQTFSRTLAGTGPFEFRWVTDTAFEYTRYDRYHGQPGTLDGFTLSFADPAEAAAQIERGSADLVVGVDPGWSGPPPIVAEASSIRIRAIANLDPQRVSSSFAFRHAVWRSLNRTHIIETALDGRGTPAYSLITPNTDHAFDQDVLRNWVPEPGSIPVPTSERIRIVTLDDRVLTATARGVQEALADLGFGSEIDAIAGSDLASTLRIGDPSGYGDFDLLIAGSFAQPSTAFAPDYAYFGMRSGLVTNLAKVADPELDRLLDEAVAAPGEQRAERWAAVQKYDVDSSLVEIPIAEGHYAESTTIDGYEPSPLGTLDHLARL